MFLDHNSLAIPENCLFKKKPIHPNVQGPEGLKFIENLSEFHIILMNFSHF
jgi:hypothetical protein